MIALTKIRLTMLAVLAAPALLGACATTVPMNEPGQITEETRAMYAATVDNGIEVPAIEDKYLSEYNKRQLVDYYAPYRAGTIVVDPGGKFLYHLKGDDTAMRYLIAVGAQGYGFAGEATIPFQRDWPYWTPTANMIKRDPETYGPVRNGLPGGLENPLGARALYLYKNGRDTLYRIHGTPSPWTVGHATSSGCIRMFNQDSIHLAAEVPNGTKVVVLTKEQAGKWTTPSGEAVASAETTDGDAG
ncbi:L,D-transpeptidase [Salipiger thiooxidans]|uniref:L,D-transpeptidase n=1 Tax=Salipiger thiooxidans TaxID=282683 RepID=UPI001CD34426|nr:L,D-transpeptidase [Salipiger thiooxidans]MCA0850660.1 L,D-transpeptidase [Salipiger thiooxidans]